MIQRVLRVTAVILLMFVDHLHTVIAAVQPHIKVFCTVVTKPNDLLASGRR